MSIENKPFRIHFCPETRPPNRCYGFQLFLFKREISIDFAKYKIYIKLN